MTNTTGGGRFGLGVVVGIIMGAVLAAFTWFLGIGVTQGEKHSPTVSILVGVVVFVAVTFGFISRSRRSS